MLRALPACRTPEGLWLEIKKIQVRKKGQDYSGLIRLSGQAAIKVHDQALV
jgi:hypothetical protein